MACDEKMSYLATADFSHARLSDTDAKKSRSRRITACSEEEHSCSGYNAHIDHDNTQ